jgi:hypothetical protein
MLESNQSDIIQSVTPRTLNNQQMIEVVQLYNGNAIVLSSNALAYYKSADSIEDPLGNGLIAMAELPHTQHFTPAHSPWILQFKAGFVGLVNDRVLLITPVAVQLFASKMDALRNQNEIARLDLPNI